MIEYRIRMKDIPLNQQPRERLRDHGPQALSDAELLAILLRVGTSSMNVLQLSQHLLSTYGGWAGLQHVDFAELSRTHGMGEAKTATVQAAIEIGRRLLLSAHADRFQIHSPQDVAQLMQLEMARLDQEHLRAICLDTKNRVQKVHTVYVGSVNSAVVRIGEVFKEAVKLNSTSVIVVHNHPSGDPTPSPEDVMVTRQIVQAGQLLDVDVLDHLVIGHGRFVSLRERGLGFAADKNA